MGTGREKDCNPESVSMASGLRNALRMVLHVIEKGLSSMKTKQGCLYVFLHRLFTEDSESACRTYIHVRT